MRFVCWQPLLTDHQAYTLAALAEVADAPMETVATTHSDAIRTAQGWSPLGLEALAPTILTHDGWRSQVATIVGREPDAIHLFCSPFGENRITLALFWALFQGKRVYLVSEPYSPSAVGYLADEGGFVASLKARLRPLVYRLYGRLMRRRLAGVFAISPLAVSQYEKIGIPPDRIFPFGYFVPPTDVKVTLAGAELAFRLCFIGSLIERKGLRSLIAAVRSADAGIKLDAYGAGDPSAYDFDDKIVRYCGMIPFGSASSVLAGYDVLVVPSRHDGWGVVVNEALLAGIPVICSSATGASALIARWGCGSVYDTGDPDALKTILASLARDPERLARMRDGARRLQPLLSPETAARYMLAAITHLQPENPWYDRP
jgi:glycosyltransferase involved in cell wall biosynthesis